MIVRVLLLEGLHSLEQIVVIQFKHVGDHTRGLFEAEASVAASAPHPLQNGAIFSVHVESLGRAYLSSGDDDGLTGDRLAVRTSRDAHAREETPFDAIAKHQDEERVLDPHTG